MITWWSHDHTITLMVLCKALLHFGESLQHYRLIMASVSFYPSLISILSHKVVTGVSVGRLSSWGPVGAGNLCVHMSCQCCYYFTNSLLCGLNFTMKSSAVGLPYLVSDIIIPWDLHMWGIKFHEINLCSFHEIWENISIVYKIPHAVFDMVTIIRWSYKGGITIR